MPTRFGIAAMGSGSGRTWLVNEDCQGIGTPSGWTDTLGSPNWDYTTVPLESTQSLYLSSTAAAARTRIDFADQTEVWIYFLFRFTNGAGPGSGLTIGGLSANGSATLSEAFTINATAKLAFGGVSPNDSVIIDTTYHVWLHYLQGSGANATADIGFSTTGVRPTSGTAFKQTLVGAQTNLGGRLSLGPSVTTLGYDLIFDKIRVATTQINDNGA